MLVIIKNKYIARIFFFAVFLLMHIFLSGVLYAQNSTEDKHYYLGREIEQEPENKTINNVEIIILPPLTTDIIPIKWIVDAGNFLHINTNKNIIQNEIAVSTGDKYNQSEINEIVSYLNSLKIISKTRCFPLKTDEENTIDLYVEITDEWSLAVDIDPGSFAGGEILNGHIGITEKNLFGLNKELGLRLTGVKPFKLSATYIDSSLFHPMQFTIGFNWNFNEEFDFDNFDIHLNANIPLVKTLRKFGFTTDYKFIIGKSDSSKGYVPFLFKNSQNPNYIEEFYMILPDYYTQIVNEISGDFTYLVDSLIDHTFNVALFLNFSIYNILDSVEIPSLYLEQYKEQLFPIRPYNYLGFTYTTSLIEYTAIKDYKVFNRDGIAEMGFRNTLSYKRADRLLGSPSNSNIFREEFYYLFDILDYLFIISGTYFFEFDINDYGEIVSEKVGINQVLYFRPLMIGQFVASFNMLSQISGNGDRDELYYLGGSSLCWVRGTPNDLLDGKSFINFSAEYRTNGLIRYRNWNLGFALFYDLGVMYNEYNFNIGYAYDSKYKPEQSAGLGFRIDYGNVNMIIIDIAYRFGSEVSISNLSILFSFYQAYRF